jgi:hypothetical protein
MVYCCRLVILKLDYKVNTYYDFIFFNRNNLEVNLIFYILF